MKYIIPLCALVSLLGCRLQSSPSSEEGEERLLLSGDWKFSTIVGEGYNYRNVGEQSTDIVIDNSDLDRVEIKGGWKLVTKLKNDVPFVGKDYLRYVFPSGGDMDTNVRYKTEVPEPGYYEHFVKFPYASHLTAQVNVKHADGIKTAHFNQRNRPAQWLSVGIFKIEDDDGYIEVTAITARDVVADAVMLRPVSAKTLENAKLEKSEVAKVDFDDSTWDRLTVPGHWGMINKYSNYSGKGWYRKTFTVPAGWTAEKGERIRLKFDAVYHLAKVYLNGEYIGAHRGGFTPFEFDVTDGVNLDSKNVIAAEANNDFLVGATWNWGGIIRDVHLVKNEAVRISYQYVHAEPNLETGAARLTIKLRLENSSEEARELSVKSTVSKNANREDIAEIQDFVAVAAGETEELLLAVELPSEDVELWHFDFPILYNLKTSISDASSSLHSRNDRFGIRKVELNESQLLLNGEPVRLAGFNRVSDHRYWGSAEPLELLEQDVDSMKEAGANFMRIMHGTQNEKLIELCDERGIMIFEEVNVRELTNPEFKGPDYPLAKQWLKEMIDRDVNHASIIGWSVGNELKDHYGYVKTTIDYVREELDEHRLITYVSNTGHRKDMTPETDPITEGDIIMQNCYMPTPEIMIDSIHAKWPNKPMFFSEFGLGRLATTSLDQELPTFNKWHTFLRGKNPFVVGASLWTYNDYRSPYAGSSEEENRTWGLVNVWRQERRLYSQIQKEHSPLNSMAVESLSWEKGTAMIKMDLRGLGDYPSYTMREYQLVWTLRNSLGEELEEKTLALPDLKPQDSEWEGTISWSPKVKGLGDLTVALVTPNGYVRHEECIAYAVPNKPERVSAFPGLEAVRVEFSTVYGADEYAICYKDESGKEIRSEKTIGQYVDVTGLSDDFEYAFTVIAFNGKGESSPSMAVVAKPNGMPLPPYLWTSYIDDRRLILGYTSDAEDGDYIVRYGKSESSLDREEITNVRGMLTVDVGDWKSCYFKIQRVVDGVVSNWSPVVKAVK